MKLLVCAIAMLQVLAGWAQGPSGGTLNMAQLRKIERLTPVQLAGYFADFEFKFHEEVQQHDEFLRSRSGDCDDYATLVADLLTRNGYTPRMIAVRMKGETHVVCYVQEIQGYLDYNVRKEKNPIVRCGADICEVAKEVSRSFGRDWIATYEFSYDESERVKRLVNNIIPNRPVTREAKVLSNADAKLGAKKKNSPKHRP